MWSDPIEQKFSQALDALVEQIRNDRSILAVILCGSLSHDRVWDKSDIDLLLITIDDKKVEFAGRALYADGVNVHALLMPRGEFRKTIESALRNSFVHSFLAKGRLLYTHDESITEMMAGLQAIGERDTQLQLLRKGMQALGPLYKARKWFLTREDLEYTALWILYAATPLAEIELLSARRLVDREVLPEALKLNPAFFRIVYSDLLNSPKTRAAVKAALDATERYLAERAPSLFALVLEHLREVGDTRSATDLENHFRLNHGIEGVTAACEYLADQGLVTKTGTPVQLTRRSNMQVEELAFFHVPSTPREHGR
jgi:hypothetical protein